MRVRVKFGSREFEFEDETPVDTEDVLELANIARQVLLAPGQRMPATDDEPREVTSQIELGFRGSVPEDEDEEDDDGE